MATESVRNTGARGPGADATTHQAHQRRGDGSLPAAPRSAGYTFRSAMEELSAARAQVEALESRPRGRCRVSRVQTTLGGLISTADEVLGLLLQRSSRALVGLPLASLIAGPERRLFADRTRALMEGPDGAEWETRLLAPGARVGVPVAVTLERGAGAMLNWYIRDLSDLRRAQARVMHLEQVASSV